MEDAEQQDEKLREVELVKPEEALRREETQRVNVESEQIEYRAMPKEEEIETKVEPEPEKVKVEAPKIEEHDE